METSGEFTDGDTRRLYDPRAGLRVKQENESATAELYLQTFHLTKRFFTELSRVGGRAGTVAAKRRVGRIQIEVLLV